MCICFLCLNSNNKANNDPRFPFICCHNRDEDPDRPSGDCQFEEETGLICARDLSAGGMVLGLNVQPLRFSALTNLRSRFDNAYEGKKSRGLLVEEMIRGDHDINTMVGKCCIKRLYIMPMFQTILVPAASNSVIFRQKFVKILLNFTIFRQFSAEFGNFSSKFS